MINLVVWLHVYDFLIIYCHEIEDRTAPWPTFFSPELFSMISIKLSNKYAQGAKSVDVFWLGKKKFQVFDDRSL